MKRAISLFIITIFCTFTVITPLTTAASTQYRKTARTLPNLTPMQSNLSKLFGGGTPTKITNAKYQFKNGLKQISNLNYSFKPMSKAEIRKFNNPESSGSGDASNQTSSKASDNNGGHSGTLQWMVLSKNTKFAVKSGDVYYDKTKNKAFKVIGDATVDNSGNYLIPVADPEMDEVLNSFVVPKQTIPLSKANICYLNPHFEPVAPPQSMKKDITVTHEKDGSITIDLISGNPINLLGDESSSSGSSDSGRGGNSLDSTTNNEDPSSEGSGGYYDDSNAVDASSLSGDSDSSSSSSPSSSTDLIGPLKLKAATINISEPKLNADIDWNLNPLSSDHANFTVDADVTSNVKIEGSVHLKKDIPILLYGYKVDIGDIADAYIGIFLDIGIDGKVSVEVNLSQTGTFSNGIGVEGYMGTPLGVSPISSYSVKKTDVGVAVSGELKAWIAATPQVGLEICGFQIIKLQVWVGVNGDCKFAVSAGTNKPTTGSIEIKVGFEAKITFWIVGFTICPLDLKFNILDETVTIGSSKSTDPSVPDMAGAETPGLAADKDFYFSSVTIDKADAYSNIVSGNLQLDGAPYQTQSANAIILKVCHNDGSSDTYYTDSDAKGNYAFNEPLSINDTVNVQVNDADMNQEVEGSAFAKVKSPFDDMKATADAFNGIVKGTISGNYADPDGVSNSGDEILYNGPIYITVSSKTSNQIQNYTGNCINGNFTVKNVPVTSDNKVEASIKPFNNDEECITHDVPLSLDSLEFRMKTVSLQGRYVNILGSINNDWGFKAYDGKVNLFSFDIAYGNDNRTTNAAIVYKYLAPVKDSKKMATQGSMFEFDNFREPDLSIPHAYLGVGISYNGVDKVLAWYNDKELQTNPLHNGVLNPIQEYINSIINPNPMDNLINTNQNNSVMHMDAKSNNIKLYGVAGNGYVMLQWSDIPVKDNFDGYMIYRGTSSGDEDVESINSTPIKDLTYTDNDVTNGTTYYYIVRPSYGNNTKLGDASNEVSAKPLASSSDSN